MSEENNDTVLAVETEEKVVVKRNVIAAERIQAIIGDVPQYEKASFLMVGHRNGVRLAIPKTNGVSRAYFYANGNYDLIPQHEAITVLSVEERKAQRSGGIMATVNFEKGLELADAALVALVDVIRNAPVPAPKGVKAPKKPRKPKTEQAVVTEETKPDVSDVPVTE